jgi:hypothetical protein
MTKQQLAKRVRDLLEKRLAQVLEIEQTDLPPRLKIGSLTHFLFLMVGDQETMPGFNTAMGVLLALLSREVVWNIDDAETKEPEAPEVIN